MDRGHHNADAFFAIGQSHTVCQDYARADQGRAVVADGCSSSLDSDVGARLLATTAQNCLDARGELDFEWVVWRAAASAQLLGIDPAAGCLDATLMCAFPSGERIRVMVAGDGVIAARRRDNRIEADKKIEAWHIDYCNAPAYLSYLVDRRRMQSYLKEGFGGLTVKRTVDGVVASKTISPEPDFHYRIDLDPRRYDLVLLLSDGVTSFRKSKDETVDAVPLIDVLRQIMAFKSTRGEFVVRRCRRFLRRFCAEAGWSHSDDLAVAGICLGRHE